MKKLLILLLFIPLTSFGKFNSDSFYHLNEELKNSLWEQEGYDRILKIDDSEYIYFNKDNFSCPELVKGDFKSRFKIVYHKDDLLILNAGGIVDYRFKRIAETNKICNGERKEKNNSYLLNFNSFWQTFDRNYAFFKERNINWGEIYNEYLPKLKTVKTDSAFGILLKDIVNRFNDGHIRLELPESSKSQTFNNPYSKADILNNITSKYLTNSYQYNDGLVRWGVTTNKDIGYIGITDMNGFSNEKESSQPLEEFENEIKGVEFIMNKILEDLNSTTSIIIDLRFNGGGYETVSLKLLSYFINEKKHILSIKAKTKNGFTPEQKYYLQPSKISTKKVYLLTSPFSSSATEIFVLGSLSFDNFTRLGSRTNGIFSEILWKQLPNGWEYSLSNEVFMDTNNNSYEGVGIDVDIDVGYSKNKKIFYSSFFNSDIFSDKLINEIIKSN